MVKTSHVRMSINNCFHSKISSHLHTTSILFFKRFLDPINGDFYRLNWNSFISKYSFKKLTIFNNNIFNLLRNYSFKKYNKLLMYIKNSFWFRVWNQKLFFQLIVIKFTWNRHGWLNVNEGIRINAHNHFFRKEQLIFGQNHCDRTDLFAWISSS